MVETTTGPVEVEVDLNQDIELSPHEFQFMGRFLAAHPAETVEEEQTAVAQATLAVMVARQVPDIDEDSLAEAIRESW